MNTYSNHHYLGGAGFGIALELADLDDLPSGDGFGVAVVASARLHIVTSHCPVVDKLK